MEVTAIHVHPTQHWRLGIGRRLCEHAETAARAAGPSEIQLWVLESTRRARRFYESIGFRPGAATRVFLERAEVRICEVRYRRTLLH